MLEISFFHCSVFSSATHLSDIVLAFLAFEIQPEIYSFFGGCTLGNHWLGYGNPT
jgi:hypothetical protein